MTFEDLEAWQKAREIVRKIYDLSRTEKIRTDFGLSGQIQRAAVSIMSNIAEGFERLHLPEKLQAYNIARGSTAEVRSLLYVIEDNYSHTATTCASLRTEVTAVGKLITGLLRSTTARRKSA